jgi:hypothetical protein
VDIEEHKSEQDTGVDGGGHDAARHFTRVKSAELAFDIPDQGKGSGSTDCGE